MDALQSSFFNLLNPKSDQQQISPYNIAVKIKHLAQKN